MKYIIMVTEQIMNESWTSEYSGIEHINRDNAVDELLKARSEYPFADVFIREMEV